MVQKNLLRPWFRRISWLLVQNNLLRPWFRRNCCAPWFRRICCAPGSEEYPGPWFRKICYAHWFRRICYAPGSDYLQSFCFRWICYASGSEYQLRSWFRRICCVPGSEESATPLVQMNPLHPCFRISAGCASVSEESPKPWFRSHRRISWPLVQKNLLHSWFRSPWFRRISWVPGSPASISRSRLLAGSCQPTFRPTGTGSHPGYTTRDN